MDIIWIEIRYAIRSLIRNPMFSLGIIFALAVGIGGTTTVYSVLRDAVFPTYPFNYVDRLISVWQDRMAPSFLDYEEWKEDKTFWDELGAYNTGASFAWTGYGEPRYVEGCEVTVNIFKMTGIQPFLGRAFAPDEDRPGKPKVVILGYNFWKTQFNADEQILGKHIILNKNDYTIIGVMPVNKGFPGNNFNLWVPYIMEESFSRNPTLNAVSILGRLKVGLTFETAYNSIVQSGNRPFRIHRYLLVDPYLDKSNILLLFGAVILLLLIACMNIASLITARGLTRTKEIALRSAVGATQLRIMRQLLWEPLILSLIGGIGGIFLALLGIKIFYTFKPNTYANFTNPGILSSNISASTLLFAGMIAIFSVVLFGLIPSFRNSQANLANTLKAAGESNKGRNVIRIRSVLVVIEIALSVVLLLGSGVIVKSFRNRLDVDLGVKWDKHLMTVYVINPKYMAITSDPELSEIAYARRFERTRNIFNDEVLSLLRQNPAIVSAAAAEQFPFDNMSWDDMIKYQNKYSILQHNRVTKDFFKTAGIPLIKGRDFLENSSKVEQSVIVSELAARTLWPGEEAIGKQIFVRDDPTPFEVIGICGEVRYVTYEDMKPSFYTPISGSMPWAMNAFILRTKTNPGAILPFIKKAIWSIEPDLPIEKVYTQTDIINLPGIAKSRFYMSFLIFFTILALVMAIVGICGLVHYVVTQKTRDICIRIAVGATSKDILLMVLSRGMFLALLGIGTGLFLFIIFNRVLTSFVFGISPSDLPTMISVSLLMLIVTLIAVLIPSIKAMRTNPALLLKEE